MKEVLMSWIGGKDSCLALIYAVDANSYFARPGPRVVDGTELLAHLIQPELFHCEGSSETFRRVEFSKAVPPSFSVASLS